MDLAERYEIYRQNVSPAMLAVLSESLGVSSDSLNRLGVGFFPKKQAWIFPERNANGDIVGLLLRYQNGQKGFDKDHHSKRGLIYEYNQNNAKDESRYAAGRFHWVRLADAGATCPICGKLDWCMVSSDDPNNPSAVLCSRVSEGCFKEISGSGYVHILDKERQRNIRTGVLQTSEFPIIIVEGASDVLAAMDLGFVAIGRPSAEGGMQILQDLPLSGKEIWIIGENDAGAGRDGMEKTSINIQKFSDNIFCVLPPDGVKDLRQWVKLGLTKEALSEYVKKFGEQNDGTSPNIFQDDVAYGIAKRFIQDNYTKDEHQILRSYKAQWVKWKDGKYDLYHPTQLRGDIYRWLEGKRYVRETPHGIEIAPYKPTARKISDIIDAFSYMSPILNDPPAWLDGSNRGKVIAFKNGLLSIDDYLKGTIKLYEPTPEYFIINTIPYDFDPDYESQLFEDELNVIFDADEEIIRLVGQWFGYNLVPDNRFEKFMLFTGPPRSGKSTLIDAMSAMIGRNQVCSTDFSQLIGPFGCSDLFGKLAVTMGDAKTPRATEAATALELMLRIIGNDTVNINQKYKEAFNAKLFCRFTIAMNEIPGFSDHSSALLARLNLIKFPNSFVGHEDFSLKNRITEEAKQGKLINFALRGLKDLYQTERFIIPTASVNTIEDFKGTTNPIAAFVGECCAVTEDPYDRVTKGELFDVWRNWCTDCGRKLYSKQTFCQRLTRLYANVKPCKVTSRDNIYGFSNIKIHAWAKQKYLQ